MNKLALPILGVLVAVLTAAVVIQAANMVRMQRDLSQLRKEVRHTESDPETVADRTAKLENRIQKLERRKPGLI